MHLAVGTVTERYIVEGVIGEGGMATVYLTRHRDLGSLHALKLLHHAGERTRLRLVQEGRLQSTLRHPNVVAVTDMVHVSGAPGLVMEYIEGPTLNQFMRRYRLDLYQADAMARRILRGVAAAHAHGMVHRDLKPANILLAIEDGCIVPKITDFGLAKVLGEDAQPVHQTRTGATMGTPGYMAPEQISDASKVDARADVFSLGAILNELVTGQSTFGNEDVMTIWSRITQGEYAPPRSLQPELPDRMVHAIDGALQVERDSRIPSVARLLETWTTGTDGAPALTLPPDDADLWSGAALSAALGLTEELTDEIRSQQDSQELGSQTPPTFDFLANAEDNSAGSVASSATSPSGNSASPGAPQTVELSSSATPVPSPQASQSVRLGSLVVLAGLGAWAVVRSMDTSEKPETPVSSESPQSSALPQDVPIEAVPVCGDGQLSGMEQCDDGNAFDGDLCTSTCTSNLARVPGGSFMKGFTSLELDEGIHLTAPSRRPDAWLRQKAELATPATPVHLHPFWIMRTEVSLGALSVFVADPGTGRLEQTDRSDASVLWHREAMAKARVNLSGREQTSDLRLPAQVSRETAVAYCAWLGGTLPMEEQWEFAARGPQGDRLYPWGSRVPRSSPEDCDLMTGFFTVSMEPLKSFNCGGRQLSPVGSHPAGCTPVPEGSAGDLGGICDLAGNADEYVLPGAVVWQEVSLGDEDYVYATPAGSHGRGEGAVEFLYPCDGVSTEDPYGMVSGEVKDCIRSATQPEVDFYEDVPAFPTDRALSVVRGGNFEDSLPVFYQTRARYPMVTSNFAMGFRCVFTSDLSMGSGIDASTGSSGGSPADQ